MRKIVFFLLYTFLFAFFSIWIYDDGCSNVNKKDIALFNYGKIIDSLAPKFRLPKDYLFALIMLESAGKKKIEPRFEPVVYKKLMDTKNGKIKGFEHVNKNELQKMSGNDLKKLACSYGPFQIMGYKIFELKISMQELTGKNNIYWALKWIDSNYGMLLRKGDYKNAFHMHNAGEKIPENGRPATFHPDYVRKGLMYVNYFNKKLKNEK